MKKLLLLFILIVGSYLGYKFLIKDKEKDSPPKFVYEDILNDINDRSVDVDTFTIYGKYLNFKGDLPEAEGNYNLILKNDKDEIKFEIEVDNGRFLTSKYINDGINLEDIKLGNYLLLLCDLNDDGNKTCYHLSNKTDYHDNKYYTMTKNNSNNLITFNEDSYANHKYWEIKVNKNDTSEEFFDVVIDPGHGGVDTGAGNGRYNESTFTLDYAKTLKEVLEEEGLKVKLTREEDKQIDNYGAGSRTGIAYESKAKLYLSIHLNSSASKSQRGVEIYRAYEDNNTFAKILADNMVKYAGAIYSNNPMNKVLDGVYMRVYSPENIKALKNEAKSLGYEPYDLTNHETYYYFIRETGGIMTHAFSDGRNKKYKENIYRNYNQGTEAYLCELAYISQNDDLKNIINNKDGYIKSLKTSVLSYVGIDAKEENNS